MDPGNVEAQEYEQSILTIQRKAEEARRVSEQRSQQSDAWKKEEEERQQTADEGRVVLRRESLNTYRAMLRQSWAGGAPGKDDLSMLDVVRLSLGIEDAEHESAEREVQLESYEEALLAAWKSGAITKDDTSIHEHLRNLFKVSLDDHRALETKLKAKLKKEGRAG